jgi:hypothetical protein
MTLIGQTIVITVYQTQYIIGVFGSYVWKVGVYGNMRGKISEQIFTGLHLECNEITTTMKQINSRCCKNKQGDSEWMVNILGDDNICHCKKTDHKQAYNFEWLPRFCFVNLV